MKEWSKSIISLIYKKGEKNDVKNYKRMTLMDMAYKMYVSILNKKLEKEIEEKLQEGQFRFRERKETMNMVYIVNYIVIEKISKKKGRIFTFFANFKVGFDKIDRKKLRKILSMKE